MEIAIEYEEYICDFLEKSGTNIIEHRGIIFDKNGNVIKRFAPKDSPLKMESLIKNLLELK
mgnify:CR=1 FL=1